MPIKSFCGLIKLNRVLFQMSRSEEFTRHEFKKLLNKIKKLYSRVGCLVGQLTATRAVVSEHDSSRRLTRRYCLAPHRERRNWSGTAERGPARARRLLLFLSENKVMTEFSNNYYNSWDVSGKFKYCQPVSYYPNQRHKNIYFLKNFKTFILYRFEKNYTPVLTLNKFV